MSKRVFESIRTHRVWNWFRHCPVCHRSFPPIEWLCINCLKKLKSFYLDPQHMVRMQSSFRHFRLIDWTSENDSFVRAVLMSLKGPERSLFFKNLAKEFIIRLQYLPSLKKDYPLTLVPCPSKDFIQDHGFFWAQALGEQLNLTVQQVLAHQRFRSEQKMKSLSLRGDRKLFLTIDECRLRNKNLVFVDDVVTSGATAKAARLALGKPESFMVWSIFWRKKCL